MEVSFFLAKIFGIYLIITALAVMVNKDHYKAAYKELKRDRIETHSMGAIALILGLLVVGFHNIWVGWPVLITLIGWVMLIKGVMALVAPDMLLKFAKDMGVPDALQIYGFAGVVVGSFLVYLGFFV